MTMENEARFTVAKAAAAQADSFILKRLHISTLSNARTRGNSLGFQLADWSLKNTQLPLKQSKWDLDVKSLQCLAKHPLA